MGFRRVSASPSGRLVPPGTETAVTEGIVARLSGLQVAVVVAAAELDDRCRLAAAVTCGEGIQLAELEYKRDTTTWADGSRTGPHRGLSRLSRFEATTKIRTVADFVLGCWEFTETSAEST